ncbi:MAG: type VI secretion system baseplate subunit TssF [Spirochaetaceae bacterium]|jgi:type VI secretion system VasI/ImpG family protein|nr:type VI secretion system baseplate subunit TssF [Spirochaetaceae bacterium]
MELLDYYRDNLAYIRNLAVEFAAEFPKIAGRLGLREFECEDPYIERLLEGTAFLSARVEKKLDDGYNNFLESVLNSISPSTLYPIPSGAVLELNLNYKNDAVKKRAHLETGAMFDVSIPTINTPCCFSTLEDVPIAPFAVTDTEYLTRALSDFNIAEHNGLAGLRIKLDGPFGNEINGSVNELMFYINMSDADASLLLRQIMHETINVYARSGDGPFRQLSGVDFIMPLASGNGLLREVMKSGVYGLKLLQNFLAYPEFFRFFHIKNMEDAFKSVSNSIEILLIFKRREPSLSSIKKGSLRLNCAPALNLFAKRSDRVMITRELYEFHITPDKTAPRDYEIVNIRKLEFFNEQNKTLFFADNFYEHTPFEDVALKNFFSQRRRKTLVNSRVTQRSSYNGTEVFVSFLMNDKNMKDAYQFSAETVCTNRDLSLLIYGEPPLSSHSPLVADAAFLTHPTRPNYSFMERGEGSDFSRISHIVFNLSAMFWQDGQFPLEALRALIGSYSAYLGEEFEHIPEGILELEADQKTFRFIKKGAVFFELGWKVKFTLDEMMFAGIGYYTFGKIIAEILKSFTPLNSVLEIHFFTKQSGCVAVWKTLED